MLEKLKNFYDYEFDFSSTERKFGLIFSSVIFAFVFLNFFQPFGLYYDSNISKGEVFVELFIAIIIAFAILVISQFVIKPLFKIHPSNLLSLLGWFLIEGVFVSSTWTFIDIMIKKFNSLWIVVWTENLAAYYLIMFLPYFLYLAYIYYKDQLLVIEKKRTLPSDITHITISDESGESKLVVDVNKLLYIKSADNYVEVYHMENNIVVKTLVRNTIKKLEVALQDSPVIRCHRSFMVNTKKIATAKKIAAGFDVKLQYDISVPVSRTYISEFKKYI